MPAWISSHTHTHTHIFTRTHSHEQQHKIKTQLSKGKLKYKRSCAETAEVKKSRCRCFCWGKAEGQRARCQLEMPDPEQTDSCTLHDRMMLEWMANLPEDFRGKLKIMRYKPRPSILSCRWCSDSLDFWAYERPEHRPINCSYYSQVGVKCLTSWPCL